VSNRLHRLMDDISDLTRIDALLAEADKKDVVSLLDLKRKIKERMAKEHAPDSEGQPEPADEEVENEIDRYYEKIFGNPPDTEQVRPGHPLDGTPS
jgi:CRISPR/Cas system CSM-associated protein Csm3 (group 7 of RAMP superfamily)